MALQETIDIYEEQKTLPHFKRIHLVEGDLCETAPTFTKDNPHVFWRIILLSVNLYQPTLATLKHFVPRLSAGGIIVIHGVNFMTGASIALQEFIEEIDLPISTMNVIDYYPNVAYLRLST